MWKVAQIYSKRDRVKTLFREQLITGNRVENRWDSIDWYLSHWLESKLCGQRNQWIPELLSIRAKDATLLDILALTLLAVIERSVGSPDAITLRELLLQEVGQSRYLASRPVPLGRLIEIRGLWCHNRVRDLATEPLCVMKLAPPYAPQRETQPLLDRLVWKREYVGWKWTVAKVFWTCWRGEMGPMGMVWWFLYMDGCNTWQLTVWLQNETIA